MQKKKLVIIGGGFAGLRLARLLRNNRRLEIVLINDSTTFRYCPALYRSATGFAMKESVISISKIIKSYPNVTFIQKKAKKIDRQKKIITTDDSQEISYDIAVIAVGMVTSYFGIDGLKKYSFNIKTPEGLKKLKNHLHSTLSKDGEPDKNYIVVGGGATGVELSAALATYLKKTFKKHKTRKRAVHLELVEASPKLLPVLNPKASKAVEKRLRKLKIKLSLGKVVKGETADNLMLENKSIPSKTVIWTAGVTNSPFFKENSSQFQLNERGKVVVNDYMQVDEHVYVIGDNAATKYSGLAQTAIHDATYLSKQILLDLKNKPKKPYAAKTPISIIPAGENWSVLQYKGMVLSGKIPAILRSVADLMGYTDIMGLKSAYKTWSKRSKHEEQCPVCKSPVISS